MFVDRSETLEHPAPNSLPLMKSEKIRVMSFDSELNDNKKFNHDNSNESIIKAETHSKLSQSEGQISIADIDKAWTDSVDSKDSNETTKYLIKMQRSLNKIQAKLNKFIEEKSVINYLTENNSCQACEKLNADIEFCDIWINRLKQKCYRCSSNQPSFTQALGTSKYPSSDCKICPGCQKTKKKKPLNVDGSHRLHAQEQEGFGNALFLKKYIHQLVLKEIDSLFNNNDILKLIQSKCVDVTREGTGPNISESIKIPKNQSPDLVPKRRQSSNLIQNLSPNSILKTTESFNLSKKMVSEEKKDAQQRLRWESVWLVPLDNTPAINKIPKEEESSSTCSVTSSRCQNLPVENVRENHAMTDQIHPKWVFINGQEMLASSIEYSLANGCTQEMLPTSIQIQDNINSGFINAIPSFSHVNWGVSKHCIAEAETARTQIMPTEKYSVGYNKLKKTAAISTDWSDYIICQKNNDESSDVCMNALQQDDKHANIHDNPKYLFKNREPKQIFCTEV